MAPTHATAVSPLLAGNGIADFRLSPSLMCFQFPLTCELQHILDYASNSYFVHLHFRILASTFALTRRAALNLLPIALIPLIIRLNVKALTAGKYRYSGYYGTWSMRSF